MTLSAVDMSSAGTADEDGVDRSPFQDVCEVVLDHNYLPTRLGALTENALVYISGFVVRKVLQKLKCEACRSSLVSDAVPSGTVRHPNSGTLHSAKQQHFKSVSGMQCV